MFFILRMALRELRASWRRLVFFFICVAVGVGAIVALRSLVQNVRTALAADGEPVAQEELSGAAVEPFQPAASSPDPPG